MKLLVIGMARHGKDTFCEILKRNYGVTFSSSSAHVNEKAVFPFLKEKYGYDTLHQCYIDRVNHRKEWFDLIQDYCKDDQSRLAHEVLETCDVYCGMRNRKEFEASKELFDVIVWVDRSKILEDEPDTSMDLTMDDADFIIDNNNDMRRLEDEVRRFVDEMM